MLTMKDLKRIQNIFESLTGRQIGFFSGKNQDPGEWVIFEVGDDTNEKRKA